MTSLICVISPHTNDIDNRYMDIDYRTYLTSLQDITTRHPVDNLCHEITHDGYMRAPRAPSVAAACADRPFVPLHEALHV